MNRLRRLLLATVIPRVIMGTVAVMAVFLVPVFAAPRHRPCRR